MISTSTCRANTDRDKMSSAGGAVSRRFMQSDTNTPSDIKSDICGRFILP